MALSQLSYIRVEASPRIELGIAVLQTAGLPLAEEAEEESGGHDPQALAGSVRLATDVDAIVNSLSMEEGGGIEPLTLITSLWFSGPVADHSAAPSADHQRLELCEVGFGVQPVPCT